MGQPHSGYRHPPSLPPPPPPHFRLDQIPGNHSHYVHPFNSGQASPHPHGQSRLLAVCQIPPAYFYSLRCPREELNPYQRIRNPSFCPLNYEGITQFYSKYLPFSFIINKTATTNNPADNQMFFPAN